MKLKAKILILALVPLVLMGIVSYTVTKQQLTKKMEAEVYSQQHFQLEMHWNWIFPENIIWMRMMNSGRAN